MPRMVLKSTVTKVQKKISVPILKSHYKKAFIENFSYLHYAPQALRWVSLLFLCRHSKPRSCPQNINPEVSPHPERRKSTNRMETASLYTDTSVVSLEKKEKKTLIFWLYSNCPNRRTCMKTLCTEGYGL